MLYCIVLSKYYNSKKGQIRLINLKKMLNKKSLLIIIIPIVILLFLIIIGLAYFLSEKEEIILDLDQEEEKTNEQKIVIPEIIYNLSGEIKEIKEDYIVFDAIIFKGYEENKPVREKQERRALITPDTKFTAVSFILLEGENKRTIKESETNLKELKIGDSVEVISRQNIKDAQEFEIRELKIII